MSSKLSASGRTRTKNPLRDEWVKKFLRYWARQPLQSHWVSRFYGTWKVVFD